MVPSEVNLLIQGAAAVEPKVAVRSSISQARIRLGWEPLHKLHDEVVKPIATEATKWAWYRRWRLVSLDGSTLDIPDEAENREAFPAPEASRGEADSGLLGQIEAL